MNAAHSPRPVPSLKTALQAPSLTAKGAALGEWWNQTRIARALARYNGANGPLLSSGMALTSLLSLTAALTVAVTAFMAVLGGNETMREALFSGIARTIPNLLKTDEDPSGLIDPESLVMSGAVSATGMIALAIMAWSAVSVVGQLGASIRAMFAIRVVPSHPLVLIARNALGALALGLSLVLGAGLGVAVDMTGEALPGLLGLDSSSASLALLDALSTLLALLVYALVSWVLIGVVAQVRVPMRRLLTGVLLIALASIVLRIAGTSVVGAAKGPLLATAATLITLVLWINLQVRAVLLICAWIADPPAPERPASARAIHFLETPNYVTRAVPATLAWQYDPVSGEVRPDPLDESAPFHDGKPLNGTGERAPSKP
ncbi:YhjD/YihY/BrkB family envelope integrity protein [Schaalia hyovaginalis]|uniref:YhjD/YihY/BrkB family envelope integrity protein n=1 Tax=Schaalia TaxID=2529408 RepID=UPI0012B3C281|nr:YhjD/YihY/BrkB family envelope integrity protein [Schaalia hyovaginalis]MCF2711497.1 YihY/virulence factor BrkB family protein [Schaalia hyovaginalis]MCI6556581.1 YihY/virulence factor BrkB family protein [Schaalia hyovaginalis]MDD7554697.1 YhjD/YihY/BrkB family envelope integrity protein [Schaalia hyovaginalis]MDY3092867.1 YhjD/YihY/BrkB family envelope integrity protein [Schaalia hyovaginalis]MDY3664901.1 YhjD/YihY/BrkB family envelope integrity protein [Schaalia hyovaginalis]